MIKLALLRHGQSTWNRENRFTGWTDVPLTEQGIEEAKEAGRILKKEGYSFDIIFTSVLKRAIDTTNIVVMEMGLKGVQIFNAWQLNERHYGALQGLNKAEMAAKYGEEQVLKWRRSYGIRPPALIRTDKRWPGNDSLYRDLDKKFLPLTESLKDTVKRVAPYWQKEILPALKNGKKILVSASGNSLRALVKYIDNVPDNEIVEFNIPTGIPLVYELDDDLEPIRHYFLGDRKEIEKKIREVAAQGKAKK
ncbi:2,3-diphosphoglycerate-dependent phosphoglycerate mutase [Candidatus Woesearchaeota archaeon]|nr:2,3-diphosphoglycerate-dependent phosphoglycerate mutase [Candidatus Woesearchaeota archaeon]